MLPREITRAMFLLARHELIRIYITERSPLQVCPIFEGAFVASILDSKSDVILDCLVNLLLPFFSSLVAFFSLIRNAITS